MFTGLLAEAQKLNTITGTIPDKFNGEYVYLSKVDISNPMAIPINIDSSYVENGRFVFNIKSPNDTSLYSIVFNKHAGGMFALDNEPLNVTYMEGNPIDYFQIRGSTLNNDFATILEFSYKSAAREMELAKKRKEALTKNKWTIENEEEVDEDNKKLALDYVYNISHFVKSNITNPAGQYVYTLLGVTLKKDTKEEIESKLSESDKQTINAAKASIAEMMKGIKATASNMNQIKVGDKYIDVEGELLSGEKITLSEAIFSKKLILLDFWASWCIPCLKEMPEIVDLHNKYKDGGLQIVGISLDRNRDKWKDAVDSFGMQWIQFIDSNLSNPISTVYDASAIPHTVLIDENGTIIALGLRGEKLKKKIEEYFSLYTSKN